MAYAGWRWVKRVLCGFVLVGAACGGGGDRDDSPPEVQSDAGQNQGPEARQVPPSDLETDTSDAGSLSLPDSLLAQKGEEWDRVVPPDVATSNGPIVVYSGGAWTAYDEQLVEISSGVTAAHSDDGSILASSWPGVAISYGDRTPSVIDVESGVTLATDLRDHAPSRSRLPVAPRDAWDARPPAEGIVIDFTTIASAPIPTPIERGEDPAVSPGGEFLLVDGRETPTSRWRVDVRPTLDPSIVLWSYDAPEGVRFLSSGHFDADGNVVLRVRADGNDAVIEYTGQPGASLDRLDPVQVWSKRYPGVPLRPEGVNVVVVTDDGVETPIGSSGEAQLACEATGWDVAVRTGEVLFFTPGFMSTTVIVTDTPRDVYVEEQGVVAWLMTNRNQGQREALGLINCLTREVWDPAEAGEAFAIGTVLAAWVDRHDNTSNGHLLSTVVSDTGETVLLLDEAGSLWPILRAAVIYDTSLSPDGLFAAVSYSWNGEDTLGIIPISFDEEVEVTSLPLDGPTGVAWLLGEPEP